MDDTITEIISRDFLTPLEETRLAIEEIVIADNIAVDSPDGGSAWIRTHGYEFPGTSIPFGAAVIYKPTPVHDFGTSKESKLI